ncbi:MAG TPA: LysM peptidoglycan-binding domain-containing protein [Solirubrobacteraceae bacterium]|nr:LysM peptidoglycan-binding domain-containing protein [Solirubrobacteraceae bacterium]
MRVRVLIVAAMLAVLGMPPAANAAFLHVVAPGESLTSIAALDGLTVGQLAAANGLPADAQLVSGTSIVIPPQGPAPASAQVAPATAVVSFADGDGDSDGDGVSTAVTTASTASYVVQPGDTLTAIAARAGTTVSALAAANGLDPARFLVTGTVLQLSGLPASTVAVSAAATSSMQPVGAAAQGDPAAPPYPTAETMSAGQIGQIGANNGATWSLADAIAWQESGFNNNLVSSSDARGIMQILPGTWAWIQHNLVAGAPPLAPASAYDNVRGGALLLHWLLQQTGGDPAMAAAGYYQGLSSVRRYGMFSDTKQYVQSVMALQARFGGG